MRWALYTGKCGTENAGLEYAGPGKCGTCNTNNEYHVYAYVKQTPIYMWVSDAINIKDYTETVTLAINRAQISVVRMMMYGLSGPAFSVNPWRRPPSPINVSSTPSIALPS